MKALLVYPRFPDTFWSFRRALDFTGKKAVEPPLGLLTVAAMLPPDWNQRLVDENIETLTDDHLAWADLVLVSGMIIQEDSAREVIDRCHAAGVKVVGGGPMFRHSLRDLVDHCLVGEAEELMPVFLEDLKEGRAAAVYETADHPELAVSPTPKWELVKFKHYHSMPVQFSRGCPFDCEFCDIVAYLGRRPRYKGPSQALAELDSLYRHGWRGAVDIVDDNFIGHRGKATALLESILDWQTDHGHPFSFGIEASVNLAEDTEMLSLMTAAGVDTVFVGIESPALDSLKECNKRQNQRLDLVDAVKTLQGYGLEVKAGFILGFDADPPTIFEDQARFIEQAGIPTAMVGLLSAGPGSRLYDRLAAENRLVRDLPSGSNTMSEGALNFIPKMPRDILIEGYKSLLRRLYDPRSYYARVLTYLKQYGLVQKGRGSLRQAITPGQLWIGLKILWRLGVRERGRRAFWAYMTKVCFTRPNKLEQAFTFAAKGYHLRSITRQFAPAA
jgi:radical SAM superfamily enzyme YgiQ (UPF0313 family)